jgi:hypothetical protein
VGNEFPVVLEKTPARIAHTSNENGLRRSMLTTQIVGEMVSLAEISSPFSTSSAIRLIIPITLVNRIRVVDILLYYWRIQAEPEEGK